MKTQLPEKINILGIGISNCRVADLFGFWEADILQRRKRQVCITPVNSLLFAQEDDKVKLIYNHSAYVLCDGMPVKWASSFLGTPIVERITGLDVLPLLFAWAAREGFSVFLLGASPGVAQSLADKMVAQYPRLRIAGIYVPPFMPQFSMEENEKMVAAINAAQPDILLVSLTAPKQDIWIAQHLAQLDTVLAIGIGGAFEVTAGLIPRAPIWMQKAGLEWFYRLIQEPKRLYKRYLIDAPQFIPLILRQKFSRS